MYECGLCDYKSSQNKCKIAAYQVTNMVTEIIFKCESCDCIDVTSNCLSKHIYVVAPHQCQGCDYIMKTLINCERRIKTLRKKLNFTTT